MTTANIVRIAAVQMNSRDNKEENLRKAEALIDRAAAMGAQLVALPEYVSYLGPDEGKLQSAEPIPGPTTERFAAKAKEHGIVLHCGSIAEQVPGEERLANTTVVIGPDGEILGQYRKIHLFDVDLVGEAAYRESRTVQSGEAIVTVDTPVGRLGLTICYDLRFPELFRALALRGADIIFAPAAFTLYTGKDHWEPLLRARAIENQTFVVAPAQFGTHNPQRQCYGNTMIIDPWGTVIARASEGETVVVADLDMGYKEFVRQAIPSLRHRRPDVYEKG